MRLNRAYRVALTTQVTRSPAPPLEELPETSHLISSFAEDMAGEGYVLSDSDAAIFQIVPVGN